MMDVPPPLRKPDRSWTVVICLVLAFHGVFIVWVYSFDMQRQPVVKPLAIQTVRLEPKSFSRSVPPAPPAPPMQILAEASPPLPPPTPAPTPDIPKEKPISIPPKPVPTTAAPTPPVKKKEPKKEPPPPKPSKPAPKIKAPVKTEKTEAEKKLEKAAKAQLEKMELEKAKKLEKERLAAKREAEQIQAKERELLAQAQETLAKISSASGKLPLTAPQIQPQNSLPNYIDTLQTDQFSWQNRENSENMSYQNQIAFKLKKTLRFPEYGSVKIKLTLARSGRVEKLEILASASVKNKIYIEQALPALLFPTLDNSEAGPNTFIFLLNNE